MALALRDAYGLPDQARPADVIVILGSLVHPGARPGPSVLRTALPYASFVPSGMLAQDGQVVAVKQGILGDITRRH